jgi:hypothetical protein
MGQKNSDEKEAEQSVFEKWLYDTLPSGDVESVQRQWELSSEYRDFIEGEPACP